MKSSASESKPFQSRSKGEIPGQAGRKERLSRSKLKKAFLIDSDAELFMYFRFGSRNVRRLSTVNEPHNHLKGHCVLNQKVKPTKRQQILELNNEQFFPRNYHK